jgi:hypothetical protein
MQEISQLRIEDVVREFADYRVTVRNDHLAIHSAAGSDPVVEARRVALKSETVPLSPDLLTEIPDVVVKATRSGAIRVSPTRRRRSREPHAPSAYRIVRRGPSAATG